MKLLLLLAAATLLLTGCTPRPSDPRAYLPPGDPDGLDAPYMNYSSSGPFVLPQTNNFRHYDKDDY